MDWIVVGSGPAGAACATALLKQGRSVHVLDAGLRLEPERELEVAKICATHKFPVDESALGLIEGVSWDTTKIPRKLAFGSDYAYRDASDHLGVSYDGVALRPSFAMGGLSSVWGGAILPYRQSDIADWPIGIEQLKSHYEACTALTGLAGDHDALNEFLPLYAPTPGHLMPSRQASAMKQVLDRNRAKLRRAGIHFGYARLAVKGSHGTSDRSCVYCGMCLDGCPYGVIYNAEDTIADLRRSERLTYQPDVVVTSLREAEDVVSVRGYNRVTRKPIAIDAERVYLAAGVIATTGILLRSLGAYEHSVRMKDSQHFLLPMSLSARISGVQNERLHTMSQLFLEILDPQISPYSVHLQVYSFNRLLAKSVRKAMGPLASMLELLAREADCRLMVVQGYLHSAHSSEIAVTLRRAMTGERLEVSAVIRPEAKQLIRKVVRKLRGNSLSIGAFPLPMLLDIGPPGRGFHSGGTFPMKKNPGTFDTDTLGRPGGWKRVHVVDATVLPSIAATTITLTVMANAHRIASESGATV